MIAKLFTLAQALMMSALLMGGMILPAAAQAPAPGGPGMMHRWDPAQMQAKIKAHLAKLHERLEIKASQQKAWDAYAKSVEAIPEGMKKRPGKDADAATLARFRAERAAHFAKKLSAIADTTAKLEAVLTPSQRQVFDAAARRYGHRGYGRHGMGMKGDHCEYHDGYHGGGKMGGAMGGKQP